jgi:selenocysteine lyase/cysteine desulfurase
VPTYLLNVEGVPARDVAHRLAERGYGVWHHDNWYSLGLHPRLQYEDEAVRIGMVHYNTPDEVDGLLAELAALAP